MRKSVKAKQKQQAHKQQQAHRRHRRTALWLAVPFVASVGLLFLSFTNWQTAGQIAANAKSITTDQVAAKAYLKTAQAKKAEAESKAKIEAEMQAKAETERTIAAAKQTNPTSTSTCGVQDPSASLLLLIKNTVLTR